MINEEDETHTCFECDAEFIVHATYDTDNVVSFCPFCGSEMDTEEYDDEEEDEDDL